MKIKRIFNFICFFVIAPIAFFISSICLGECFFRSSSIVLQLENLFITGSAWTFLILAYRYLIKLFDSEQKEQIKE